jgi:hypothetical protein
MLGPWIHLACGVAVSWFALGGLGDVQRAEKCVVRGDYRAPVMPALNSGRSSECSAEPPDEAAVLRAMPKVAQVPYLCDEFRDDILIVKELVSDQVCEPRCFPLTGPARIHHRRWKCTVYYTDTLEGSYPFPFRCRRPRMEVVYIDQDHLHLSK